MLERERIGIKVQVGRDVILLMFKFAFTGLGAGHG